MVMEVQVLLDRQECPVILVFPVKEELMVIVDQKDVLVVLDNQDQKELQECKDPLVLVELQEFPDYPDHRVKHILKRI